MVAGRSVRAGGSLLVSLRVQALVSLVLAVVLPAVVRYQDLVQDGLGNAASRNSIIAAVVGVVFGLFLLRRVTEFPGTRAYDLILPSYATSYGLVLAFLFASRFEYARIYMASSFGMAIVTSFIIGYWLDRYGVRRFYVVPAGNVETLLANEGVDWVIMRTPEVPAERFAPIVADLHHDHDGEWERTLAEAAVRGHPVYHTKLLGESLTGKSSIDHLSENSFGSLVPNLAYRKVKRVADVVGCIVAIPILIPVLLGIALIIRLDSAGPVLFLQERMGYRGQPFRMFKFRTMRPRPPIEDEEDARADAMTRTDDDRVTQVGRFLRRSRLDELPQVWNVLRGEMSWIGPRPEAVSLSQWYDGELPFYLYRHIVRPGITGWAQVNLGHVTSLEDVNDKLKYDFYYIKNLSAGLDILIVLRTVQTILSGFGSK
ncbi:sugar transferase [Sphingomonas psychrotolerans]|uniref:Sugar transferase n=1 Tax=Sphingomonas psychrotolerans TaxID=1327635 RepID=A0A2K8MK81_9SPHN|nr:sugar transferase [Sphingomonas psychrotolerans]ATY34280.1 sugar transferase [Sphingomonas psychrotolerans]